MRTHRIALILGLALFLAAPMVGLACEGTACSCHMKDTDAAEATAEPSCCAAKSDATLASSAEQGCEMSYNTLIARAKKSDNEEAQALAAKAEGGCEHSKTALIAMMKESDSTEANGHSMAQLASNAENGCSKSAGALIAHAKDSDNKEMADLAKRAAGGCEHSKAALIAMAKETEEN